MRHFLYSLLSIFTLLLFSISFAQEEGVMGRLYAGEGKSITLIPGEIFTTQLQLMNANEEVRKTDFKQLEGQEFAGHFYVISVGKAEANENNADVWQVSLTLALKHYFEKNNLLIAQVGTINFPLSFVGIDVENISVAGEEYYFANQFYRRDWMTLPILIIGSIVIVLLCFLIFKVTFALISKKRKMRELSNTRHQWIERLHQAAQREDWELLYSQREAWRSYISEERALQEFEHRLFEIQYQKEWSETQVEEMGSIWRRITASLGEGK